MKEGNPQEEIQKQKEKACDHRQCGRSDTNKTLLRALEGPHSPLIQFDTLLRIKTIKAKIHVEFFGFENRFDYH